MRKGDIVKLKELIFVRLASHGREQVERGQPWDECYGVAARVYYVGPSKVIGHSVVTIDGRFIRVSDEVLA